MLDKMATKVRERLPNRVFGEDRMTLATAVARAIEGKTLALLETNTGGLIAAQLLAAGALHEGQVLPCHRIELTGSREQTAVSMADQLRRQTGAQLGLAILGQDDPEMGPHCEKTGETALAVSDGNNTKSRLVSLGGTSDLARSWLAAGGLELLRRFSM